MKNYNIFLNLESRTRLIFDFNIPLARNEDMDGQGIKIIANNFLHIKKSKLQLNYLYKMYWYILIYKIIWYRPAQKIQA